MDIPIDKSHPVGAGQCDGCGGTGCDTCGEKGWLPAGDAGIRRCENPSCVASLPPDNVSVYCSNECAFEDV